MSAFHPQNMLVADLDRPVYRGCHSPFTPLVRRCDDPKTPPFNRLLVGTVSIFRGGLALELSPCARSAWACAQLSCREGLVTSCDRARFPRRGRHHRTLLSQGAPPAGRPGRRLALRRAQRLRQDFAGRPRPSGRPSEAHAQERRQTDEVRSYEIEYVGALWHLDFHHGSKRVLSPAASGNA
jgi:hypothetical protein